jgi:hypothetical protein
MMSNYIKIRNLKLFTKSTRKNIVMVFPRKYSYQIDNLISLSQTENLVRKYIEPGYNNEFIISDDKYDLLCNEIKKWIYNASLSLVASSGTIECAWDDESNEMIFWHPESNEIFNTIK